MLALRSIARNRKLDNPDRAAEIVKNKMINSVKSHRDNAFANWHDYLSVETWMRKAGKPVDWVCCLVRYATNKQTRGRLRGSKPLTWLEFMEEAAKIRIIERLVLCPPTL